MRVPTDALARSLRATLVFVLAVVGCSDSAMDSSAGTTSAVSPPATVGAPATLPSTSVVLPAECLHGELHVAAAEAVKGVSAPQIKWSGYETVRCQNGRAIVVARADRGGCGSTPRLCFDDAAVWLTRRGGSWSGQLPGGASCSIRDDLNAEEVAFCRDIGLLR